MQRRLGVLSAALIALAAISSPVRAATAITDPAAFVADVYQHLVRDKDYTPPEDIYSARLAALWADEAHDAGAEVGRVDFLFWINGQDGAPKGVQIKPYPVEGRDDRRVVVARFRNQGQRDVLQFYFERTGGAWRLDDVVSLSAKDPWTLSLLLKYGGID